MISGSTKMILIGSANEEAADAEWDEDDIDTPSDSFDNEEDIIIEPSQIMQLVAYLENLDSTQIYAIGACYVGLCVGLVVYIFKTMRELNQMKQEKSQ